jgi:lipopolysaccharide/colanic/teichoic acid biosynthesis glycosyltransferase
LILDFSVVISGSGDIYVAQMIRAHPTGGARRLTRDGVAWRAAETVCAAVALVALSPILVLIAAAILADARGPVLFLQPRIGRHGRAFRVIKFRTMRAGDELDRESRPPLEQPADHPRLTRVGPLLRRTHLDELPQLANVIAGQMSIVGPRPLVPSEDALVTRVWPERHAYRPGLTGLWQVHRTPQTTIDELIRFDRRYVVTWSPWRDVRIAATTVRSVVRLTGR